MKFFLPGGLIVERDEKPAPTPPSAAPASSKKVIDLAEVKEEKKAEPKPEPEVEAKPAPKTRKRRSKASED